MATLVVFESMFGATRDVAGAVGEGLAGAGPVRVVEVTELVGGPEGGALPGGKSSYALGINGKGQIVGYADNPKPTNADLDGELAVIWTNGKIAALDDQLIDGTGWFIQGANAINDAGQIAAYGYDQKTGYAGVLLTPSGG